jgi:hypothetical protein
MHHRRRALLRPRVPRNTLIDENDRFNLEVSLSEQNFERMSELWETKGNGYE